MFKKIALVCGILFAAGCAHTGFFGMKTTTDPVVRKEGRVLCAMAVSDKKDAEEICVCGVILEQGVIMIFPAKKWCATSA